MSLQNLMTLPEVAQDLGINYLAAWNLVVSGRLPARLFASRWIVDKAELKKYKRKHG